LTRPISALSRSRFGKISPTSFDSIGTERQTDGKKENQ
jgi:hypothetical protein